MGGKAPGAPAPPLPVRPPGETSGFPPDPFPGVCRIDLGHASDVGLSGRKKKKSGPVLRYQTASPRFERVRRCHGARVALQRCPILRDNILLIM